MIRTLTVASLLLFSVGCASLKSPTASVRGVSVKEINSDGFTLDFAMDVSNPNAVPLPVNGATYAINVAGKKLVDGSVSSAASIPANGRGAVTVPVKLGFKDLLDAQEAIVNSGGDLNYRLSGALEFDNDSGVPMFGMKVPLEYNGKLALREILKDPKVLLGSTAARELAKKVLGSAFGF